MVPYREHGTFLTCDTVITNPDAVLIPNTDTGTGR